MVDADKKQTEKQDVLDDKVMEVLSERLFFMFYVCFKSGRQNENMDCF